MTRRIHGRRETEQHSCPRSERGNNQDGRNETPIRMDTFQDAYFNDTVISSFFLLGFNTSLPCLGLKRKCGVPFFFLNTFFFVFLLSSFINSSKASSTKPCVLSVVTVTTLSHPRQSKREFGEFCRVRGIDSLSINNYEYFVNEAVRARELSSVARLEYLGYVEE